jgi:methyl-accepting chemotaxis protein
MSRGIKMSSAVGRDILVRVGVDTKYLANSANSAINQTIKALEKKTIKLSVTAKDEPIQKIRKLVQATGRDFSTWKTDWGISDGVKSMTVQTEKLKLATGDVVKYINVIDNRGRTVFSNQAEVVKNFGNAIDKAESGLEAVNNRMLEMQSKGKGGFLNTEQLKKEIQGFKEVKSHAESFTYQGQELTRTVKTLGDASGHVTKRIEEISQGGEVLSNRLIDVNKNVEKSRNGLANFGQTMIKVFEFQIVTKALNALEQFFAKGIQSVFTMDEALTEFKKVSDLSGDSLTKYTQELGDLGETVARTTSEMIDSATQFRKSGFSDEQSKSLARISELCDKALNRVNC